MLESLSLMGYDALGIGDDDLTLGKEFLGELSKKAPFPFLSSNLIDAESGKLIFQSYLIKEVNGLKVGIFSLLGPDAFSGPQDPRLKGLTLQNPIETAQRIARELKPMTDLVILLSHLGYPKDVEMAQTIPGIHIIAGGHSGVSLTHPPIIKDTVILQSPMKGMYFGQFELTYLGSSAGFYNTASTRSMGNNLSSLRSRSNRKEMPKTEREQYQRMIGDAERSLKQMEGKNQFTNTIFPLTDQIKEDPRVLKLLEDFKTHFQEPDKTSPPKQ
jgi:2',3'-cyclic-nucleotide 2'-phosphodiesterase (5'-nucleotidase family)